MPDRAMPSFTKSPPALVERFGAVLDTYPTARQKPMFGFPAAFVGGNLATSLFRDRWVVRVADDEVDAATAAGAGSFEPVPGRPMRGFVTIPPADVDDETALRAWVERGIARAAALPPKK